MVAKEESLFPLEQRLKGDAQGMERDALLSQLEQQAKAIRLRMDAGVAPGEFIKLGTLQDMFAAAIQVVNLLWRRHHPT